MNIEDYIKEHFVYENGIIRRNDRKNSNGSIDKYGYLIFKIKGKQYKAHRVAWLLCNGNFPNGELDHINRNKLDNRIENLRISNRIEQNRNKDFAPNHETHEIGICIDKTKGLKKKYSTRILGKTYRFYSIEEAKEFRKKEGLNNGII